MKNGRIKWYAVPFIVYCKNERCNASENLVDRFYSKVDENDIKESENFEEFFGVAKDKCENIWSEDDLNWIANYVWNDYWSKY